MEMYWESYRAEAAALAEQHDGQIARRPTFLYTKRVKEQLPHVNIDMEAVTHHLVDAGLPEQHLGALAIRLADSSHGRMVSGACIEGVVYKKPQITERNTVYYPFVDIIVPTDAHTTNAGELSDKLNCVMRHELRHIQQQRRHKNTLYRNELFRKAVGIGGLAASVAFGVKIGYDIFNDETFGIIPEAVGMAASMTAHSSPLGVIHRLTPSEIDADLYAWRHPSFKPIHIGR
jgi:hypothetical protein